MTGTGEVRLSVVVPTFNESANVLALLERLVPVVQPIGGEVLFVDDSVDDTPDVIRAAAQDSPVPVRLLHREAPVGGLSGAVVEGLRAARGDVVVVMDGDLQHPPETIPALLAALPGHDVVAASRYLHGGAAEGLAGWVRHLVSVATTLLSRAMFPRRLHGSTDPMTGFFAVDRSTLDAEELRPRGFKILLEILVRRQRRLAEVPFSFADRHAGASKASWRQGRMFLHQMFDLRFGLLSGFAAVGIFGALLNLLIVWLAVTSGLPFVLSAIIAAEVTIVGNFVLLDRLVFADLRAQAAAPWRRFARSFAFNNVEAAVRIGIAAWFVDEGWLTSVIATAATLAVAFVLRFAFHSLVVYRPEVRRPR